MEYEEDEDGGSSSQMAVLCDKEICAAKRKRRDGIKSPTKIDFTKSSERSQVGYDGVSSDQNRFALLGELEFENTCSDNGGRQRKMANDNSTVLNKGGIETRRTFCPPIFLYNVNITHLVAQLEAKSPKIIYKIKNVNKQKSKLYISDPDVHSEMMTLLREKKVKSYSFTPKEFKQISMVLRGLYYKTDTQEIKTALDKVVPDTVCNVSKFTTSLSKKNNTDTGLFLISLSPGKKLTDIAHVRHLLNQTVVWEKPHKKNSDIQCHRCQHWGHVARNCNSDYKCVKCDKSHPPGECDNSQSEGSKPICVNCGEPGHPANWRGCDSYKKYVKNKLDRMRKVREEKSLVSSNVNKAINSSIVSPGMTFAGLFQPQLSQKTNSEKRNSPIIEEFLKLANFFLEPEELTLEQEIINFLNNYKNMPKIEAKGEFQRLLKKINNFKYGP